MYLCSENKGTDQLCSHSRFSHDEAQIMFVLEKIELICQAISVVS